MRKISLSFLETRMRGRGYSCSKENSKLFRKKGRKITGLSLEAKTKPTS